MNGAYEAFSAWHGEHPHLLRVLLAGTLVSATCGAWGCFIVLRRTAFLGDALAHSMLAGVTAGYLVMKLLFGVEADAPAMLIGSLAAGAFTAAAIGWVSRISRVKEDTAIGMMYTGVFAAGGLAASYFAKYIHIDLVHFLTGNVLAVRMSDLWMIAIAASVVWLVILLFFRTLQLTSFDPVMAASIGIPTVLVNHVITACTSLLVVSGVNVVGVILVVGLLITPAATAYLLCDRLRNMIGLAAFFGWTSFLLGYALAVALNVAPGSAIVVVATLQFCVALVLAPRYGLFAEWVRRRAAVNQSLVEDVLGWLTRSSKDRVAAIDIGLALAVPQTSLRKALARLNRDGLLTLDGAFVSLTEAGSREARRLVRSHRLWEAYLEHVGTPPGEIHAGAHVLEHVHDEEAVDYLDDKLGHPTHDPHGEPIPEDFVHLVPGAEVNAALLREGRSGVITRVDSSIASLNLRLDDKLTAGPRRAGGKLWSFRTSDGRELALDHSQADAVRVRVLE